MLDDGFVSYTFGLVAHEPWAFGSEVEETCRIAINRRYILMPYIYTLFHRASITGTLSLLSRLPLVQNNGHSD
jgi:hypothetical protein